MQGRLLLIGLGTMVLSMCLLFPAKEMLIIVAVAFFFCTNPFTQCASAGFKKTKDLFL